MKLHLKLKEMNIIKKKKKSITIVSSFSKNVHVFAKSLIKICAMLNTTKLSNDFLKKA
jgi:hypothetical protein